VLYEKVKQATNMVIGTKQTKKAIEQGKAQEVIVAKDADDKVTAPIISMCRDRGIAVVPVDSMRELGKACGIEVGAAAVAILK